MTKLESLKSDKAEFNDYISGIEWFLYQYIDILVYLVDKVRIT